MSTESTLVDHSSLGQWGDWVKGKMIHDFASAADNITLLAGTEVFLQKRTGIRGWKVSRVEDGRLAIVPNNYLEIDSESQPRLLNHTTRPKLTTDWSGRGNHVEYRSDEKVPLKELRFLGHGINGGVWETRCPNGMLVAWKKKYCRKTIGPGEKKEIDLLKKLRHRHVIGLVGTYSHRQFLGILLAPVATCDLATLLDDLNTSHFSPSSSNEESPQNLKNLDLVDGESTLSSVRIRGRLMNSLGCMASAIAYLHDQNVRHKDLKPSNILFSKDGMWLTDLDQSTDFSLLSTSLTGNGQRGTPKYFAPEVADYLPNVRSADIFALGCIFLEVMAVSWEIRLERLSEVRPKHDGSYQANLEHKTEWMMMLRERCADEHAAAYLMLLIDQMIAKEPALRPSASPIAWNLAHFRVTHVDERVFCMPCCHKVDHAGVSDELNTLTREHSLLREKYVKVKKYYFEKEDQVKGLEKGKAALEKAIGSLSADITSKLSIRSFKIGDLVLWQPTSRKGSWTAFNIGAPDYFLQTTPDMKLEKREWMVARITSTEQKDSRTSPMPGHSKNLFIARTWWLCHAEEIDLGDLPKIEDGQRLPFSISSQT